MVSVFVDNEGVRLHVLDNRSAGPGTPVLVAPGTGEDAEDYGWQLDGLGDRRVVIADVRGRGRSAAPASGYSWQQHCGDVSAVAAARGLRRPILLGYSRGTPTPSGPRCTCREGWPGWSPTTIRPGTSDCRARRSRS